jgi:hypothetical protein
MYGSWNCGGDGTDRLVLRLAAAERTKNYAYVHCFRGARAVDTARECSFLLTYMALRRQHMADKDLMEGAAAIW